MNIRATLAEQLRPRYLMCNPQHFAVTYSINPWMNPKAWAEHGASLHVTAMQQWDGLHRAMIRHGVKVEVLESAPGLPDLVFTANAAVVLDGKALLARFHHPERRREEPVYAEGFHALKACGFIDEVIELSDGVVLEGAGDCLWDERRRLFWMGTGFRSDKRATAVVDDTFGVPCIALELADPSFYHLDTALCPLPCGGVIYHPGAFTPDAQAAIELRVPPEDRIALTPADAALFAANAVCFGRVVVMSSCSEALRDTLTRRGYTVVTTLLNAFLRSGGSACCLTLRLDRSSRAVADAMPISTAAG